jgi:hypothetical protein
MTRLALLAVATLLFGAWWLVQAAASQPLTQAPGGGSPPAPAGNPPASVAATPEGNPEANPLERLMFSTSGWKTDFSKHTVPLSEIQSGGVPRDGIPPIDQPQFQPAGEVDWLEDVEPVIALELEGEARAYPLQILMWHEIANDVVGSTPVAVTFCPLCNTGIAFDRRVEGVGTVRFGVSGNLRHSDLIMWDDATESWWQQVTGEAIVGSLAGYRLTFLPVQIVGFGQFRDAFPEGQVLSRETGFSRPYGSNPYLGYDDVASSPFLYSGPKDGRLPAMERVVAVELEGESVAYPFTSLAEQRVVHDSVGGVPIVVFHQPGAVSALDRGYIPASRDVGAAVAFRPEAQGQKLTFSAAEEGFVDSETGSTWNILGQAVAGPLEGSRLEPVEHGNHFWFAWAAFKPGTRVWQEGG